MRSRRRRRIIFRAGVDCFDKERVESKAQERDCVAEGASVTGAARVLDSPQSEMGAGTTTN